MRHHHVRDTTEARRSAYPDVGDQLDAIAKGFKALADQGYKLPPETQSWLAGISYVKSKYRKTTKTS